MGRSSLMISFKWLGGGDRFQLDPVSEDRLMEQGILELVEEPVSARMFNMASLKSISAIASLLHEKYDQEPYDHENRI
jgi:hypothetical protein